MEELSEEVLDFLSGPDRQTVLRSIREIRGSNNPLYVGKRLTDLHQILAPFGYFIKALTATELVQRTAYGYMYGYRNAIAQLPPGAVQAMMDRKLTINANHGKPLGEWTEVVAIVPPPQTGSSATYSKWVDELIKQKPKRLTGHQANRVRKSPEELMEECTHVIERALKRLPTQKAIRERFARNLISITMKYFGLDAERFSPAESLPHSNRTSPG